jgi:hypothetical protein
MAESIASPNDTEINEGSAAYPRFIARHSASHPPGIA